MSVGDKVKSWGQAEERLGWKVWHKFADWENQPICAALVHHQTLSLSTRRSTTSALPAFTSPASAEPGSHTGQTPHLHCKQLHCLSTISRECSSEQILCPLPAFWGSSDGLTVQWLHTQSRQFAHPVCTGAVGWKTDSRW